MRVNARLQLYQFHFPQDGALSVRLDSAICPSFGKSPARGKKAMQLSICCTFQGLTNIPAVACVQELIMYLARSVHLRFPPFSLIMSPPNHQTSSSWSSKKGWQWWERNTCQEPQHRKIVAGTQSKQAWHCFVWHFRHNWIYLSYEMIMTWYTFEAFLWPLGQVQFNHRTSVESGLDPHDHNDAQANFHIGPGTHHLILFSITIAQVKSFIQTCV